MEMQGCVTDDDYEAWRAVRLAVLPDERCLTVEEMREQDSSDRLLLLAVQDGDVVGSGIADRSDTAGRGFVAPRVLPGHRRTGVGSALLRAEDLGYVTTHTSITVSGTLPLPSR